MIAWQGSIGVGLSFLALLISAEVAPAAERDRVKEAVELFKEGWYSEDFGRWREAAILYGLAESLVEEESEVEGEVVVPRPIPLYGTTRRRHFLPGFYRGLALFRLRYYSAAHDEWAQLARSEAKPLMSGTRERRRLRKTVLEFIEQYPEYLRNTVNLSNEVVKEARVLAELLGPAPQGVVSQVAAGAREFQLEADLIGRDLEQEIRLWKPPGAELTAPLRTPQNIERILRAYREAFHRYERVEGLESRLLDIEDEIWDLYSKADRQLRMHEYRRSRGLDQGVEIHPPTRAGSPGGGLRYLWQIHSGKFWTDSDDLNGNDRPTRRRSEARLAAFPRTPGRSTGQISSRESMDANYCRPRSALEDGESSAVPKLYDGTSHALLIGVGSYQSHGAADADEDCEARREWKPCKKPCWDDLPRALRHVNEVGELLKDLDFEVEKLCDPSAELLHNRLVSFMDRLGKETDRVILFYAGHGLSLPVVDTPSSGDPRSATDTKWLGYVVPRDAPFVKQPKSWREYSQGVKEPEIQWFERQSPKNRIDFSLERFRGWARAINVPHVMLVFDTGLDGSVFIERSSRSLNNGPRDFDELDEDPFLCDQMVTALSRDVVRFISAAGREYGEEREGPYESFLTKFIGALEGRAPPKYYDQCGYLRGKHLARYLKTEVPTREETLRRPQDGSRGSGRMVFEVKEGVPVPCQPP